MKKVIKIEGEILRKAVRDGAIEALILFSVLKFIFSILVKMVTGGLG